MSLPPRLGTRPRPDLPFRYIGGDPALDLVNTVDWTRNGPDDERLTDYGRLTEFAEGAAVINPAQGERLRELAAREQYAAAQALDRVHRFRDALERVAGGVVRQTDSPSDREHARALAVLNAELGAALAQLRICHSASGMVLEWSGLGESLESPLWPLAWSAAQLLTSEEQSSIRVCGGPDCGWVYVDRSRNRMRRWCQMETCGNRAKATRRSARIRRAGAEGPA